MVLRRISVVAAVCAALAVLPAASGKSSTPRLTVLAASSLTDVLPQLAPGNLYSFGGSDALATQIEQGAPADLFASANTSLPAKLHVGGLVERPVPFTRNALVVVVPASNPAQITSVRDLAGSGVSVDVANTSVPVGGYTQKVLQRLGLAKQVNANVVSRETDVRTVLAKVSLGQADAGFVYATDARTVAKKVHVIRIPASAQPNVTYAIAVVTKSTHQAAARALVDRLRGKAGQALLAGYGFLPLARGA
jgi:molybdate transport system substrate-binding protein